MSKPITDRDLACVAVLHYLRDLFTATPKRTFTQEEILVLIDMVGHDEDIIAPGSWEAMEEINKELSLTDD